MMPLYGFLQGDTMGLLILAEEDDTAATLAKKVTAAARVRVESKGSMRIFHNGRQLDDDITVARAGIEALDRIDAVRGDVP